MPDVVGEQLLLLLQLLLALLLLLRVLDVLLLHLRGLLPGRGRLPRHLLAHLRVRESYRSACLRALNLNPGSAAETLALC
jgi:hypothetical protein